MSLMQCMLAQQTEIFRARVVIEPVLCHTYMYADFGCRLAHRVAGLRYAAAADHSTASVLPAAPTCVRHPLVCAHEGTYPALAHTYRVYPRWLLGHLFLGGNLKQSGMRKCTRQRNVTIIVDLCGQLNIR